jgi:alpha-L-arabinofuranosidase
MSYQEPKKLFALAGRDETNGDIILKVVNAKETVFKTTINLDGITKLDETAQLTTLSADELKAENSFSQPKKYIPQQEKIVIGGRQFEMEWRPFSINILRIKDSGWKK